MWEHMVARHRTNGGPSDGHFDDKVSEYLAHLGQQGWELAAATTVDDGALVLFSSAGPRRGRRARMRSRPTG